MNTTPAGVVSVGAGGESAPTVFPPGEQEEEQMEVIEQMDVCTEEIKEEEEEEIEWMEETDVPLLEIPSISWATDDDADRNDIQAMDYIEDLL